MNQTTHLLQFYFWRVSRDLSFLYTQKYREIWTEEYYIESKEQNIFIKIFNYLVK